MDSITKVILTREEITSIVNNAFGDKTSIISVKPLEDGWFNAVYLLTLSDGREVVLKVAPPENIKVLRYEKNIMNTEVYVMKLLKDKTDVPVPEIYCYDVSKSIICNEYFIMDRIKGIPYDKAKQGLQEKQRQAIEIQFGHYNREINRIVRDKFGNVFDQSKMGHSWSEIFLNMVRDVLKDGKDYDVKLPREYEFIEELFNRKLDILDKVKEACLVHWDLHDGNVFIDESGERIVGIIDFERAFYGDPLIEMYFGGFFDRASFIKGYGTDLRQSAEDEERRMLYDIYLALIMVIECKYRKVENPGHLAWTYENLEKELARLE